VISYELFGDLHGVIDDHDASFDHQLSRAGTDLIRAARTSAPT
jgi:hypothetical protein